MHTDFSGFVSRVGVGGGEGDPRVSPTCINSSMCFLQSMQMMSAYIFIIIII